MDAGLALSYLHGISSHFDWSLTINGSFPDSISTNSKKIDGKMLMIQSDLAFRARLFANRRFLQPFLTAGIGGAVFQQQFRPYVLLGPGVEFNYKDAYFTLQTQYRVGLSENLNNHYYYSLGIAGLLGSHKKSKPVAVVPVTSIQRPVIKDSDGDGIIDSLDACPFTPGVSAYRGCPDSDLDGITDQEDQCPSLFGVKKYGGCPVPDRDKDGINDEEDSCILVPGVSQNHGCPLSITAEAIIDSAARLIFFKTGSYELESVSYKALDRIAIVLQQNPKTTVAIQGYTDNRGTESSNLLLSMNRANAVLQYLVSNGIDMNRLRASGFGQTKPIATNQTEEGRAMNRRVEFVVNQIK